MSELKITQNSLENAILKDGQLVFGYAIDDSSIIVSGQGAHAEGYVNRGTIDAVGNGAHAEGYINNGGEINASGYGTIACGCIYNAGTINALGNGAYAGGYISISSSIFSRGNGSFVYGGANNGIIDASGMGAVAMGYAKNGSINANGSGAIAMGYTDINESIDASGNGAVALGVNTHAIGNGTFACGNNTIAGSSAMTAIGKYNNTSTNAYFVVGNGTATSRKDAFVIDTSGNVSIGGATTAKVNNISNVQLGVPIGSMTMWLGASSWAGYDYPVENDPYYIPDGWLLANGASVRLRYIGQQNRSDGQHVTTFHNNTDYVYIPRYTISSEHDNYFDHWDKFELVAYRHTEHQWIAISSEYSKFNRPDDCYVGMESSEKEIFTRFLNHVILSTNVYVVSVSNGYSHSYYAQISRDVDYNNNDSTKDAKYLETYNQSDAGQIDIISWYSNSVSYNTSTDILIALPDMNLKFPLGARQGDINKNFGDVATRIGNPIFGLYANTFIGASGGEETHILNWKEMKGHSHPGTTATGTAFLTLGNTAVTGTAHGNTGDDSNPHNNIPPYMAVHFIIKYK